MANLIYVNEETAITWLDSGGTNVLTLTSLGAGAGRQGAVDDFGVAARSLRYAWRFYCQFATAPVVGEIVDIYWKSSDGTHLDNDDGTGDAALSAEDKLNNLTYLGSLVVDEAAADIEMGVSGVMEIPHSQGMPVIWNGTADAFTATASEHGFTLTPIPMEVQ